MALLLVGDPRAQGAMVRDFLGDRGHFGQTPPRHPPDTFFDTF